MKGHMFCASQASTAVCLSMDHIQKPTSSSSSSGAGAVSGDERGGGRTIDRHNPIIKEGSRRSFAAAPCSSVDDDVPYRLLQITEMPSSDGGDVSGGDRKSSAGRRSGSLLKLIANDMSFARKSFSCARSAVHGSSRYLLGSDPGSVSGSSGPDPVSEPSERRRGFDAAVEERETEKKAFSSSDQVVVVLRVSLHCKGCEGKVRKHLSRMRGVKSFTIDFASKKVTVTGDITPLEVLTSISKVKNAQLWTPPQHPLPRANLEIPQQ